MNLKRNALAAALLLLAAAIPVVAKDGWVLLGERTVTDRADRDVIAVTGARGDFKSIKVKVFGRAVEFHDMDIHFANGETQDVNLRDKIPAGGESRVIDIEGSDRVIRSIEFHYDAQAARGRKAKIKVFGQH
jgi:Protein of unknown function (DUF2541)